MARALKAATLYFIGVFAIGFVLGTVRTLFLVPRIGETLAVCVELPIMLIASWMICRSLVRRYSVDRIGMRLAMGGVAFLLLMSAEFALSTLAFHRAISEYFAALASPAGMLGLAGQIAFAFIPAIQAIAKRDSKKLASD